MSHVELITLGDAADAGGHGAWDLGGRRAVAPAASAVAGAWRDLPAGTDAVLVLDGRFPLPHPDRVRDLLGGPADGWHAGLRLGLDGQPRAFDHVDPLWMLNAPLDPTIEATSWRLSLRALLVRRQVVDQLGGPGDGFDTLTGAGLDLGLRWIGAGALLRHVPDLAPEGAAPDPPPSTADGLRIVGHRHGRLWAGWALQRSVVTGDVAPRSVPALSRVVTAVSSALTPRYEGPTPAPGPPDRTVSVVVPTVDRYPYLEPLLHQLAAQTTPVHEVVVVDQTPLDRRRTDLATVVPGLPLTVLQQDEPGQSTARNAAIAASTGDALLFIDDDDEIDADLVAEHLRRLGPGIDASCGGVDDADAGPPPPGFRHRRASDTFPTNNSLLRRDALVRAGGFDPAFDRGPRADHDLGMRLHLGGAVLVYDPTVMVFHHHAPSGGLRVHGARAVTRASSRRSLTQRNLPAVTELLLGHRYATTRQRREARAIRRVSLLTGEGSRGRRLSRVAVQLALWPSTRRRLLAAEQEAVARAVRTEPRRAS